MAEVPSTEMPKSRSVSSLRAVLVFEIAQGLGPPIDCLLETRVRHALAEIEECSELRHFLDTVWGVIDGKAQ